MKLWVVQENILGQSGIRGVYSSQRKAMVRYEQVLRADNVECMIIPVEINTSRTGK